MKIRTAIITTVIAAALTFGITTPATAVSAPHHHFVKSWSVTLVSPAEFTASTVVGSASGMQVGSRYDRAAFSGLPCGHTYRVQVAHRAHGQLVVVREFMKVTTCKGQWTR